MNGPCYRLRVLEKLKKDSISEPNPGLRMFEHQKQKNPAANWPDLIAGDSFQIRQDLEFLSWRRPEGTVSRTVWGKREG